MLGPVEDETEFDEVIAVDDISSTSLSLSLEQPDSPVLSVPSTTPKKFRGKGLIWEDYLSQETGDFVTYASLDLVKIDAFENGYSKMCSCLPYIQYKCNRRGCEYKRKYSKKDNLNVYVSFFNGIHCHEKEQDDDRDARGLSCEQKVVIHDAFSKNIQSAREIKHFFRAQRIASKKTDPEGSFPMDPPECKLKNYIQAYKRSNAVTYNPSLGDLIEWCQKNGSNTVNNNDENTLNTPFVLNFFKVSSYYYVLPNLKYVCFVILLPKLSIILLL